MKTLFSMLFVLIPSFSWALGSRPSTYVPIKIGTVTYSGSGCPSGTASVTLTPDATALSVIFDQFTLESESTALSQKSCQLKIQVELPKKKQIVASEVFYRGFASVPTYGLTQIRSEMKIQDRFGIHGGPLKLKSFRGFFEDLFTFEAKSQVQSRQCGDQVTLILKSELRAQAPASRELTIIELDSIDSSHKAAAELNFFLQLCR